VWIRLPQSLRSFAMTVGGGVVRIGLYFVADWGGVGIIAGGFDGTKGKD